MNQSKHTLSRQQRSWQRLYFVAALFGCYALWQLLQGEFDIRLWISATCMVAALVLITRVFDVQQQQIARLQQQLYKLSKSQQAIDTTALQREAQPSEPVQRPTAAVIDRLISQELPTLEQDQSPVAAQAPSTQATESGNTLVATLFSWFKGGNSIVRIAVVVLLIGVVLLLRFASVFWQFDLATGMTAIAIAGASLSAVGYWLRAKRFDYAISLQGLGLAVLILVVFSAYRLELFASLLIAYLALTLLLIITLLLAISQNALILAFIALASGFLAPFVLNYGSRDVASLMGYYFVLNSALAVIAHFKAWRILNTVALAVTFGLGGVLVWSQAQATQYFAISCWVWAIFALYLFISVRYSQHIVQAAQDLKDIAVIDSSLIFATPFMVFSLYAGLVESSGYKLSIASAILAGVYLALGGFVQRGLKNLTLLAQCFYGLGLMFSALIIPFAFNAYWSSVGWAIHGIVMLYLAWRYQLSSAKYFALILLLLSGVATVYTITWLQQSAWLAASILMLIYALASYYLQRAAYSSSHSIRSVLLASGFILLSFMCAVYVYQQSVSVISERYGLSLALLCWLLPLQIFYHYRLGRSSRFAAHTVLSVLLFSAAHALMTQVLPMLVFDGQPVVQAERIEISIAVLLWGLCFLRAYWPTAMPIVAGLQQLLFAVLILQCATLPSIWCAANYKGLSMALLPVCLCVAILYVGALARLKTLLIGNWAVVGLGSIWLIAICLQDTGTWALAYLPLLNPLDLLSIAVFALLCKLLQPNLARPQWSSSAVAASLILVLGLLLISSIMLRMLHHFADLPYWSAAAWQDSSIQTSLTILWAIVALLLTSIASKKCWRYLWMLGIATLVIVIAKLLLLDLSHSHTLMRIVSFIGSGLIMLLIGYLAPLPPEQKTEQ